MTNRTKIIISTLIIGITIVATVGIINNNKTKMKKKDNDFNNIFNSYVNGTNKDNNKINDVVQNNSEIKQNSTTENKVNNNSEKNIIKNTVIGKEEQESNNENTEVDNEKIAKDLAKKEWGISVNSYDFEAELKSEGIYKVSVINKTNRNVITIYTVNIKTGTVTE